MLLNNPNRSASLNTMNDHRFLEQSRLLKADKYKMKAEKVD